MNEIINETNQRIYNWLNGKPSPPIKIEYNLTNDCNLNCLSCNVMKNFELSPFKPENEISKERSIELIENASEIDAKIIKLSGGGEPLRKDFAPELLRKIKSRNLRGELISNGTLLNEDIARELIETKWDSVVISLDGPDAKTNDHLRGRKGAFKKSIKNIKRIQDMKESLGKTLPRIEIASVWSKGNTKKLSEMAEICKELDLDGFILQPLRIMDHRYDEELLIDDKESAQKELERAKNIFDNSEIDNNLSSINSKISNKNSHEILTQEDSRGNNILSKIDCLSPFIDVKVYPNGDVGPCQNGGREPNRDAQSLKSKKLNEIWYSRYFDRIRKKTILGELKDKENFCKSCCGISIYKNRFKDWLKRKNLKLKKCKISYSNHTDTK